MVNSNFMTRKRHKRFLATWLLALVFSLGLAPQAQGERLVIHIQAEGPLTPAMLNYVQRGVRIAQERDAEALIFQLDTPGGEVNLMQDMVKELRGSRTPVVVYIAPQGAAGWSAGTVVALAAHVIAMAPETGIGAASPVGLGEELPDTMVSKVKQSMRALVRELAAPRGERVVEWAEAAIEDAVAASASEALEMGLADLIAGDLDDLLRQLDGLQVQVRGEPVILHTAHARVERVSMSLIERILHIVVDSTIVLALLSIGAQAILIEISNPGGWVAGFIGIVCIALGVYGLGVLPANGLGLVLIALAVGLFVMDVNAPTHGALTLAGTITMIAGALTLFNSSDTPQYARISPAFVAVVALCFAGTSFFILTKAVRSRGLRPQVGVESLVGAVAQARTDLAPQGTVFVQGERWRAEAQDAPIAAGEEVEIVAVQGFCLYVKRKE
jgi:membrane-bound serine protease (ClpP class)